MKELSASMSFNWRSVSAVVPFTLVTGAFFRMSARVCWKPWSALAALSCIRVS